jgi:hypothetical protein
MLLSVVVHLICDLGQKNCTIAEGDHIKVIPWGILSANVPEMIRKTLS